MKIKVFTALTVLLLAVSLVFSSCASDKNGETELSDFPDPSTQEMPLLEDMCPPTYSKEITVSYCFNYEDVDKSSFKDIDADDALLTGLDTDAIYRDADGREYYLISDGAVIMTFLEGEEAYSAYYRNNGTLKYFGDSVSGWFFNEDGTLNMMSYTYIHSNGSDVVTYYEPDGTRFVISAAGTYYDSNFDELSGDKQLEFLARLGQAE